MTYTDIINRGLILPEKPRYTMRDYNTLKKTHGNITARFIVICSAIFHGDPARRLSYATIDKMDKDAF